MHNDSYIGHPFVETAREFCRLVEQIDGYQPEQWLAAIGASLLRLESTIAQLVESTPPAPHVWPTAMEKRFELFSRIKDFLGDRDEYWSEADLRAGDGYMTGSLSDDFADIYFELKRGLILHRLGNKGWKNATRLWTSGYRHHWRQHLIDARKQLFEFRLTSSAKSQSRPIKTSRSPKKPI